jgi:hypothetical protein
LSLDVQLETFLLEQMLGLLPRADLPREPALL